MSHARNVGIEHARGEWLTFVDADDRLEPNHLQLLMEATQTGEPEIVVGGYTTQAAKYGGRKEVPACESKMVLLSKSQQADLPYRVLCIVWNTMYHVPFLSTCGVRFDEGLAYGEDTLFTFQCLLVAERVNAIPMGGYVHWNNIVDTNACSQYYPYMVDVQRKQLALACQLLKEGGRSKEAIAEHRSQKLSMYASQHWVGNVFMHGNSLSLAGKVRELRRTVFDDEEVMAAIKRHLAPLSTQQSIIGRAKVVCLRLRSPWLMALCLTVLYSQQKTWRRLRDCLRR